MSTSDNMWSGLGFARKNSREIRGALGGWKNKTNSNVDPNAVFVINDIELIIPPTQIVVKKENLHWSWKTLRSKISTKIASGNAINYIGVTIAFTPDLILHLHRLITQFKQSPFCYVRNKFIRQAIAGDWPVYQNMAFTMTSLNVSNMPGFPGSFIVQIEMKYFDYRTYTPNFLFKDEWKTKPIKLTSSSDDLNDRFAVMTIPTVVGANYQKAPTILTYEVDNVDPLNSYSMVLEETRDKGGKLTLNDLMMTHAGVVFDLLPLPNRMQRSRPVPPYLSNIYIRYINDLQMKSLYLNFGIDVWDKYMSFGKLKEFDHITIGEAYGEKVKQELLNMNRYGKVYGLHTGNTPNMVRNSIIKDILSSTQQFRIWYDQYLVYEESSVLREIKYLLRKKGIEKMLKVNPRTVGPVAQPISAAGIQFSADTAGYPAVAGGETDPSQFDWNSQREVHKKYKKHFNRNAYGMNTSNPARGQKCPTAENLLFYPPIRQGSITSPFGMRDRRKINREAKLKKPDFLLHEGVDIVTSIREEALANGRGNKETRYDPSGKKTGSGKRARIGGVTPIFAPQSGKYQIIKDTEKSTWGQLIHTDPNPIKGRNGESSTLVTKYFHMAPVKHWDMDYIRAIKQAYGSRCLIIDSSGNPNFKKGMKIDVKRGDIIGVMGNTGGSTGPHLHFGAYVDGVPIDPWLLLNAPLNNPSVANPTPPEVKEVEPNKSKKEEESNGTSKEGKSAEEAREESSITESFSTAEIAVNEQELDLNSANGGYLTSEDLEEVLDSINTIDEEGNSVSNGREAWKRYIRDQVQLNVNGYYQYNGDYRATNVYKRSRFLTFDDPEANVLNGILKESVASQTIDGAVDANGERMLSEANSFAESILVKKGLIVTAVGGSLQHIVANIPIVGLEYPTHQHLGSIEPSYFFEFQAMSDEATNLNADGLDAEAQVYLALQNELQSNAKSFRQVPDSYTLIIDSFITRLLGTYSPFDIYKDEETNDCQLIKRCLFSNLTVSTIEGSPGRHAVFSQFSETNSNMEVENINSVISEKDNSFSDEDIEEALNKIDNLNLEDHGKMALAISTFGKVMNSNESKEFYKERKALDEYESKYKDRESQGNGEIFLAGFEVTTEKVFVKKKETTNLDNEDVNDAFYSIAEIEPLANALIGDFAEEKSKENNWGWGTVAIGTVATGALMWLTKGKGTAVMNTIAKGGQYGKNLVPRMVGAGKGGAWSKAAQLPGRGIQKFGETGARLGSSGWGTTVKAGAVFGGTTYTIADATGTKEPVPITEELLEEAAAYLTKGLKEHGYELEEKEVIVSNAPVDSDTLNMIAGDKARVYRLPDGRVALEAKALDTIQSHFSGFQDSDSAIVADMAKGGSTETAATEDGEEVAGSGSFFAQDITDFINAYPQYQSLTFKGESVRGSLYSADEKAADSITQVIQYNKAIQYIRATAYLMLAEPFAGGMSLEEIETGSYKMIKKTEKNRDGKYFSPSGMFTSFFFWTRTYLSNWVSNYVANSIGDGVYTYMSESLGYDGGDIDRLFKNLHIKNDGRAAQDFNIKFNSETLISANDMFQFMPGKIKRELRKNNQRATTTDWSVLTKTFMNGGMSDILTGLTVVEGQGELGDNAALNSGANIVNAFGGDGINATISKLERFYNARDNIALSHLELNLAHGGYGLAETVINNYLPFLGGILNMFASDKASMYKVGFTGMYPQLNEISKYLLAPRSIGGVPANIRYKKKMEASDDAGWGELTTVFLGRMGQDITSIGQQLAFESIPEAGGTIYGVLSTPGVGWLAKAGQVVTAPLAAGATSYNMMSDVIETTGLYGKDYGIKNEFQVAGMAKMQQNDKVDPGKYTADISRMLSGDWYSTLMTNIREKDSTYMRFLNKDNTPKSWQHTVAGTTGQYDMRVRKGGRFLLDVQTTVTKEDEAGKLASIKEMLYILGVQILKNPEVSFAIGMESNFADDISFNEYTGIPCYPDLDLPLHPYYSGDNIYATSPDFYMWNVYEDGPGGLTQEIREMLNEHTETSVMKSYTAMKRFSGEGVIPKNDRSLSITDAVNVSENSNSTINSHFEGSDVTYDYDETGQVVASTPCVSAFYGGEISENTLEYIKREGPRGISALEKRIEAQEKEIEDGDFDEITKMKKEARVRKVKDQIEYIKSLEKGGVDYKFIGKLSNWDGSTTYHERSELQIGSYEAMYNQATNIEKMFGSRAGYTGEHIMRDQKSTSGAFEDTLDTRVASNDQFAHQFDPESLKQLAKDSVNDIISEKFTMRRAYPTFKLYFIEEDEWESRFINFDDFYSFNGVKEFTITRSRSNPGDVATIVLQNVSGTLDGTKRTAFRDIDYFDRKKHKDIKAHYGVDTETTPSMSEEGGGTAENEQPFGSIVMRPGMNVQLRCGYSNDPNMLEVMVSGRVTEISWGQNADMCEITVQSFGTELSQYVKAEDKSFWTTHQLLGAMMVEPELQHFGRFEFDHMSQHGENKDQTLDFYQYGQDSDKAKWGFVNATGKFFSDWGGTIMLGSILAIAAGVVLKRPGLLAKATGKAGSLTRAGGTVNLFAVEGSKLSTAAKLFGTIGNSFKFMGTGALKLFFMPKKLRGWGIFGRTADVKASGQVVDRIIAGLSQGGKAGGHLISKLKNSAVGARALNSRLRKIFKLAGNGKHSSKALAAWKTTDAGVEFLQIQAKIIQTVKSGAKVSDDLLLQYQNGLRGAEQWARSNAFFRGNLSRLTTTGMASGPGVVTMGQMGFRTLWEGFNHAWKTGVLIGFGALGANSAFNHIKKTDALGIEAMKRFHAKQKARILQSPADDNLYPPNPMSYLRLSITEEETDFWSWGNLADHAFKAAEITGFASLIGTSLLGPEFDYSQPGQLREAYNQWANPEAYMLSKRITVDQSEYFIKGKRIWDMFFEMSLKHPGWIFGPRPYGHKFQYTMFFGVPSQRYWSKPATPFFNKRINLLRGYLLREQTKLNVLKETWKNLYGENEYEAAKKEEEDYGRRYSDMKNAQTLGMPISFEDEELVSKEINTLEARLELRLRSKIVKEYLLGLENRFVPFRRYHMLTSEEDIVSNNISASMHNVANAVNVIFYDSEGNAPHGSVKMKASSSIPENKLNMSNVDLGRNVRGYNSALRYGQGALLYGMREMYRGELLVLGNHRIQPWDICMIFDKFNQMSGPIEVKTVTHMFSHETGFLTEIVPSALVIGNEISTYPVLEALKIWMGATMSAKDGKLNLSAQQDENTYTDSNGNKRQAVTLDGHPDFYAGFDPSWDQDLLERYKFGEKGNFDLSELLPEIDEGNEIFRSNSYFSSSEGMERTLNTLAGGAVWGGDTILGAGTGTGLGLGGTFLTQMFGPMFKGKGTLSTMARSTASWKGAGVMVFGGMALGTVAGFITGYSHSSDPTRRWLMTAPLVLNKLMENEAVICIPLLKDNRPILSGLSYKDPMSSWRTVLGNLVNEVADTVMGIQEYTTESLKYGDLYWQKYDEGTREVEGSRDSWAKTYFKAETYWDAFFNRQS